MTTEAWERREILVNPFDNEALIADQKLQGQWRDGSNVSELRFVVVDVVGGANKLYVQWLTADTQEVSYSISIREFNVSPEYSFGMPECLNSTCTQSTFIATHAFEGHTQTFQLNLVALGRYSVGLPNARKRKPVIEVL